MYKNQADKQKREHELLHHANTIIIIMTCLWNRHEKQCIITEMRRSLLEVPCASNRLFVTLSVCALLRSPRRGGG